MLTMLLGRLFTIPEKSFMDLESPLSPWPPRPSVPWGSSSDASWTNPKVTSKAQLAPPEPSRAPFLFGFGKGGDLPVRRHVLTGPGGEGQRYPTP